HLQRVDCARAVVPLARDEDLVSVRIDRSRGGLPAAHARRATGERALRRLARLTVSPRTADVEREFAALQVELVWSDLLSEALQQLGQPLLVEEGARGLVRDEPIHLVELARARLELTTRVAPRWRHLAHPEARAAPAPHPGSRRRELLVRGSREARDIPERLDPRRMVSALTKR